MNRAAIRNRRTAIRRHACLLLPLLAAVLAGSLAAPAETDVEQPATPAAFAERAAALKVLLDTCIATPSECKPDEVGADQQVMLDDKIITRIRLDWLRAGIARLGTASGSASGADRHAVAAELSGRLARLDDTSAGPDAARIEQGRAQMAQVLATEEFAPEPEPNWFQRKWKEFKLWLYGLLARSAEAISNTPSWARSLFELLLFSVPVILLLVWMMRQVRADRLHPAVETGPRHSAGPAPSAEWLALAEELARQSLWREAIHALYWATIATLESRRLWSASRTRTPREYIRLLAPGSPVRAALTEQTRLFELAWYGQHEATEAEFNRASQLRAAAEAR